MMNYHETRQPTNVPGLPAGWSAEYVVSSNGYERTSYTYEARGPCGQQVSGYSHASLLVRVRQSIKENRPKAINLDVDECVAAWLRSALHAFGFDAPLVYALWAQKNPRPWDVFEVLPITEVEGWNVINALGADFWADIEPLPWMHELVSLCQSLAPTTLLTSASKHESSYSGKARWIAKHLPGVPHYIGRGCKSMAAHPRALLIDDSPKNCAAFTAPQKGGDAIIFPGYGNDLYALAEDPMPYVREQLAGRFVELLP